MTLTFKESVRAGELLNLEKRNQEGKGEPLSEAEQLELDDLKRRALQEAIPPELPDDPNTLLVDESRRPELDGSGDYFAKELKRDVRETVEDVGRAAGRGFLSVVGEFFKGLFTRR